MNDKLTAIEVLRQAQEEHLCHVNTLADAISIAKKDLTIQKQRYTYHQQSVAVMAEAINKLQREEMWEEGKCPGCGVEWHRQCSCLLDENFILPNRLWKSPNDQQE